MKRVAIGCLVLALLLGVVAAVAVWPYLSLGGRSAGQWDGRDFHAELEQLMLEASGLDEPGAVNGYDAFMRAIKAYESLRETNRWADPNMAAREIAGLPRESHFDAEFAEGGRLWLESDTLSAIDAALTEAAGSDGFASPLGTPDDPLSRLLDLGGQSRGLARLLSARTMIAVHEGDFVAAASNVDGLVTVSQPFAQHPTLLGRLMAIAVSALAMEDARRVAMATDDAEVLRSLEQSIDRAMAMPELRIVLEGDRLVGLAQLMALQGSSLPIKRLDPHAQAEVLEAFYDRAEAWAAKPEDERTGESPGVWADSLSDSSYSTVKMLLPAIDRFLEAEPMIAVPEAGTRLVIAIRRYMVSHGELPANLQALVPEFIESVPVDPFNASGFVYKPVPDPHTGAPFTLYSLGLDGVDNGGKPPAEGEAGALTANGKGTDENFTAE